MADIHSNVIGWSYDGCPIYGVFGYADPLDISSTVIEIKSGWRIKSIASTSRPNLPLGTFVEDYDYIVGSTTLDRNNGRFCITPDYPNGRYCYFSTNTFPYYIGANYRYKFDEYNHRKTTNNCDIPLGANRIKLAETQYPTPQNDVYSNLISIDNVSTGAVDSYRIEFGGVGYKIGDIIRFDSNQAIASISGINNSGGVVKIDIIESDNTLTNIPKHTIISTTGFGVIIVFTSSNIGKIKSVSNITSGDGIYADPTIRYHYQTDTILELKYNNKILKYIPKYIPKYGGIPPYLNYIPNTDLEYTSPSLNYYEYVNYTVLGVYEGALLIDAAVLVKSDIPNNIKIYYGTSITNYVASGSIKFYNKNNSTIQVSITSGEFVANENYYIWDEFGNKIAKLVGVKSAEIYAGVSSGKYIQDFITTDSLIDNYNVIADNHKHQIYSYNISSPESIVDWKPVVNSNTHMIGNQLTSTQQLSNIVRLYNHSQQIINNLVDYKINLETIVRLTLQNVEYLKICIVVHSEPEDLDKNTQMAKRQFDYVYFDGVYANSNYNVFNNYKYGDLIWSDYNREKIILEVINPKKALVTDYSIIKFNDLVQGSAKNSILEYNGVIQHPLYNYLVTNNLANIYGRIYPNIDRLSLINLSNTNLIYTDKANISNQNSFVLRVNTNPYVVINKNKFILFINSVVNTDYTVTGSTINLPSNISGEVFGIYSDNILLINITIINSNVYNLGSNIGVDNVLVFGDGVIQHKNNYAVNGSNLIIDDSINLTNVVVYRVYSYTNIDINYQLVEDILPDIVPAVFNFTIIGGKIIDLQIVYPGLYYPRYLKLNVLGGSGAVILLETLNGSVVRYNIINGGIGYADNPNWTISGFSNIESLFYPLVTPEIKITP